MRLFLLALVGLALAVPAWSAISSRLNIEEVDGSPSTFPWKFKVPNASLTDNGDGTATLSVTGGGSGGIISPGTFTWTNTSGMSLSTVTVTSTSTLAYVTISTLSASSATVVNNLGVGNNINAGATTTSPLFNTPSGGYWIGGSSFIWTNPGTANTVMGVNAGNLMDSNTTGNTIVGNAAGSKITGTLSLGNTFVGRQAGNNPGQATNSTFIGNVCGKNAGTITQDTCIGAFSCSAFAGANINTCAGYGNCTIMDTGDENAVFGANAGVTITGGSKNTLLGTSTDAGSNLTLATAIGYGAIVSTSSTIQLGGESGANAATVRMSTFVASSGTVSNQLYAGNLSVQSSTSTNYEAKFSTSASIYHVAISTNGHLLSQGGVAPTISACGATPSGSVVGNDITGTVTVGGGVPTSCTLTFLIPYETNAPTCVVNDVTNILFTNAATTTSTLTIKATAAFGGDVITYFCLGRQ